MPAVFTEDFLSSFPLRGLLLLFCTWDSHAGGKAVHPQPSRAQGSVCQTTLPWTFRRLPLRGTSFRDARAATPPLLLQPQSWASDPSEVAQFPRREAGD